jgi:hypothetical protein
LTGEEKPFLSSGSGNESGEPWEDARAFIEDRMETFFTENPARLLGFAKDG